MPSTCEADEGGLRYGREPSAGRPVSGPYAKNAPASLFAVGAAPCGRPHLIRHGLWPCHLPLKGKARVRITPPPHNLSPTAAKALPKGKCQVPELLILYRPPKAAPNAKPNGVGLRWRGGARERAQFSSSGGNGDKRTLRRRSERRGAVCRLSHPRLCDDCQGRLIGGPPAITPAAPTEPGKPQAESRG